MQTHAHRRLVVVTVLLCCTSASARQASDTRNDAERIVSSIQRADYEGDREALRKHHDALTPLRLSASDHRLVARLRYWQGFAMWRRAFNGFNVSAGRDDLERDLWQAVEHFEDAARLDSTFVDANVGAISCLQNLTFLHRDDAARVKELVPRFVRLMKESLAAAPENPRLLWVQGASQWYSPPELPPSEVAARHATALATYARGLSLARAERQATKQPLDPAWGEPELLVNLAWSHLNSAPPDIETAESYARQALELVPYWRYLRDILMPQIRGAAKKIGERKKHQETRR